MKIVFFLNSPFPTSKAYGVTTQNTVKAATELGHQCSILAPSGNSNQQTGFQSIPISGFLYHKIKFFYRWKISGKMAFLLIRLITIFHCVKHVWVNKPNLVWTRDLFSSFIIYIFKPKHIFIVCEIHRINSRFEKLIISFMSQKKSVILAPIREGIIPNLGVRKFKFVVSGMAVNKSFLEVGGQKSLEQPSLLNLVYIGRAQSSDEALNVRFLTDLARKLDMDNFNCKINVIGIPKEFFDSKTSINIVENVTHDLVPELLFKMDIGLVIYPNLNYFKQSFPLKIVEYAAMNLFILASKTESHQSILGFDKSIYFEPDDVLDCYNKIRFLASNWESSLFLRKNARKWSENNTYTSRVSNVLNELHSRL